ncbi:GerAB/ArcD/ProY family transporter [Bacillus horti]|uniref:Spore germination protein (Amino acid permease) n=1 Tax=Caldalkalibacillus horti TaxID=77523 RepID=A0ABT9VX31_9BACI|nr:GerAB/ArcD/ProY family transporter [Bacillus horti]MDQ0165549.1 spore germination protein (amino acid permease) [Bacillus horti]
MAKEKLNYIHIIVTVYVLQLGVDMFRMSNMLAEDFGTNGWIAILIVSIFVVGIIYTIGLVYRLGEGKSIFEILENHLPKFMLYPFYLGVAVLWTLIGTFIGKHYIFVLQMLSFPTTSQSIFNGMLIFLAIILFSMGIYNMVKAATIFFFFTVWTIFVVAFYLPEFEFIRLTTHFFSGGDGYIKGFYRVFVTFFGFELVLLLFPYMQKNTPVFKATLIGHLLLTSAYVIASIVCFGVFSLYQLKYLLVPGLELLSYIELPFVERVESLIFNLFIGEVIVSIGFYFWGAQEMLIRLFRKHSKAKKAKKLTLALIAGIFVYSMQFDTLIQVHEMLHKLSLFHTAVIFGLPIVLLSLLFWEKRKEKKSNAKSI